jgi:hypothetical protein
MQTLFEKFQALVYFFCLGISNSDWWSLDRISLDRKFYKYLSLDRKCHFSLDRMANSCLNLT